MGVVVVVVVVVALAIYNCNDHDDVGFIDSRCSDDGWSNNNSASCREDRNNGTVGVGWRRMMIGEHAYIHTASTPVCPRCKPCRARRLLAFCQFVIVGGGGWSKWGFVCYIYSYNSKESNECATPPRDDNAKLHARHKKARAHYR